MGVPTVVMLVLEKPLPIGQKHTEHVLRSLSARLILAAGNFSTLTCLASILKNPYT